MRGTRAVAVGRYGRSFCVGRDPLRLTPRELLPALHRHVNEHRLQLPRVAAPSQLFGRDFGAADMQERLKANTVDMVLRFVAKAEALQG